MNVIDDAALAAAIKTVTDPLMSRVETLEATVAQQAAALEAQTAKDASGLVSQVVDALGPRIDKLQGTLDRFGVLADILSGGGAVEIGLKKF